VDDARPDLGNAGTAEERRTGLGGSDAAAALGLSPWRTPYELWEQKVGVGPPTEQNEMMLWGKLLEETVRQEYARRTGYEVRPVKQLLRHPKHGFMFAHIDGEIGREGRAILEVKTARTSQGWGEPETDEIPLSYLVQVHHYLAVTEAEVCDVAVLIGGSDFRLYQVGRDAEIEEQLIKAEATFWELVTRGVPPPPTTIQDAMRHWGRFDAQGVTEAGRLEIEAVNTLRAIHSQKKSLEKLEADAKLILMASMGEDGQSLVQGDGELLATWKLDNGRKGYSVPARPPARRLLIKGYEEA
jgi:putative phage-type endonuclease